jgi:hypothetical protein
MRPSLFLLLLFLLLFSLGADSGFVGCGFNGNGSAGIACTTGNNDDPCDYVVTVQATVLLAADDSPVQGAAVHIVTGPPDDDNTRTTDSNGIAFWDDTAFLTGFSADCDGQSVGTVEPYEAGTSFSWLVSISATGFAHASTLLTINRQTRDAALTFRLAP